MTPRYGTTRIPAASRSEGVPSPNAKKRRTVTRSVRLDAETDGQLVRKAEKERVSVNTVIANALHNYIDWAQHKDTVRNATISFSLLDKMMSHLTKDQAEKLGRWYGENAFIELVNYLFGGVRFTSVAATLALMSRYSGLFDIEHTYERPKHHLRLHHGSGENWSHFYIGLMLAAFGKARAGPVEVSRADSILDFSIAEPTQPETITEVMRNTRS